MCNLGLLLLLQADLLLLLSLRSLLSLPCLQDLDVREAMEGVETVNELVSDLRCIQVSMAMQWPF